MIPRVIHFCWFGRNPKPKLAEKCIKSWKKYCRDYQIIEWNEDNFDISAAPLYVRQAYEAKKWAFITDYVRLWAMTQFGGVYMDTDVELLGSIDKYLANKAFSGFESSSSIPTGIMACEKDFPLFLEFLKYYDTATFINKDGTLNTTTNVTIITNIALEHGLIPRNQYQVVSDFVLYPSDVFCPIDYTSGRIRRTERTIAIHWFAGSWHTDVQKERRQQFLRRQKKIERIHNFKHIPHRILRCIVGNTCYEKIKTRFAKR